MNDRMPQLSRHDLGAGLSRDEVLEEVIGLVRRRVAAPQQEMVVAFVRCYYGQVAPEDLDN